MFEVTYSNNAIKFLKNCDKVLTERILEKIEELKKSPFHKGVKW
jgi:mRNA-degrading endonuclease RelE of RelBE toxin-antitoxin system